MKSIYKILFLFALVFSFGSSCEKEEVNVLLQDMAIFDRAYIPVLFYVRHGEMDGNNFKELNYFEGKLQTAISDFNIAVKEAEGENLVIAATFLKVAYLDYLSSFGDFISSKSYYASL